MEVFFDEVFTPGWAYKFVKLTKLYAYPKPFLSDKKVRTYITHGAPSLPVRTLYLKDLTFYGCTYQPTEVFKNLIKYIENNEIKPLVAKTFPLEKIVDAQKEFLSKKFIS